MRNKKIILLFLILLIIIFVVGVFSIRYAKNKKEAELTNEYTPEEEISEEQERQTIVSLYFIDNEFLQSIWKKQFSYIHRLLTNEVII